MALRLSGKVAIVTGSSSGLGRAIAIRYALEGAQVVCADLKREARKGMPEEEILCTDELIRENGGLAIFVETDVSRSQDFEALIQKAVSTFDRLDILVNNAGIAMEASRSPSGIHETPDTMWETTMAVNAKSVFLGSKYAITQMLKQEPHSSGHRGWIVNISSAYGLIVGRHHPCYTASKAAVVTLTKQAALDYADRKIHCNVICPGHTQTAIFADTIKNLTSFDALEPKYGMGFGTPEDIAGAAVFLTSDEARWITGATLSVDGGFALQ